MAQKKPQTKPPGPEDMDRILQSCGISLAPDRIDLLWQYHNRLRQANPELNLTRIHRFENMVIKLYADSILPGELTALPSPLLDLGTGPGMPGIPLKIAFPDTEIVLAETRQNRVAFLEQTIADLGLSGIRIYGHAVTPSFEQMFAGVITRAVEHMDKTLHRIQGCVKTGGLVIFMKGPGCADEITAAKQAFSSSFELRQDTAYSIGDTPNQRRLVIFERTDAPPARRRQQAAQKHRVRNMESAQNATYKDLKKLLTAKGMKKQNQALVSGTKQIRDIIAQCPDKCLAWISWSENQPPPEYLPSRAAWYRLTPELFDTLDVLGTRAPLLLVEIPSIPPWQPEAGLPLGCTVLVPFQDPENVGAVIRSAVAFGAENIVLLAEAAYPFHPRAIRASGGAVMHTNLMQGPSIGELPADLPVVALSMSGMPLFEFAFPQSFALLPGMEGPGLPRRLKKNAVSIPMSPKVESLNAAAAAAIALYTWSRTRRI